jgi:hypothetical protein
VGLRDCSLAGCRSGFLGAAGQLLQRIDVCARQLLGVENREVMVAGHRVHYEVPKDRPAAQWWCWCMGWAAAPRIGATWRPIWPKPDFRVYLPDLIGYGRSEKPRIFPILCTMRRRGVGLSGCAWPEAGGPGRMVDGRRNRAARGRRSSGAGDAADAVRFGWASLCCPSGTFGCSPPPPLLSWINWMCC